MLTSHLKSFQLLDSIRILRQFHPWNISTTWRPSHLRCLHFSPNGLFPAVQRRSLVLSPTSITRMDFNRISSSSRNNSTIPHITGTTGNTLLLSILLPWQIQLFTPTLFRIRILHLTVIIHLKQQNNSLIASPSCKFVMHDIAGEKKMKGEYISMYWFTHNLTDFYSHIYKP